MNKKTRIILIKSLNCVLVCLMVIFLLDGRAKIINLSSSSNGHLPLFNQTLNYTIWDGMLDFEAIPKDYIPTKKVGYEGKKYISFTDVVNLLTNIEYIEFIELTNQIKNEKIIRIDNPDEFEEFSKLANSLIDYVKDFYLSANYVLGKDINFEDYPGYIIYPIGNNTNPFVGTFDGQGFEIKHLELANEVQILNLYNADDPNPDYTLFPSISHYALFANVGQNGKVRRLGLIDPILSIRAPRPQPPMYPIDMGYAASLVGYNLGTIEYTYCIDTRDSFSGGFDVRGGFKVAGLIGENNGTVRHAYYAGQRIIYPAAQTNATSKAIVYVNNGIMEEVYYDQSILVDDVIDEPGVIGKSTLELMSLDNCLRGSLWRSYDFTVYDDNLPLDYPRLIGLLNGGGTQEEPFLISSPLDLLFFSEMIDLSPFFRDKYYKLTNCIDMSQISTSAYIPPISGFAGVLDGQVSDQNCSFNHREHEENHSIINLHLSQGIINHGKYNVGLFSNLIGTVKNINFVNGEISNLQETSRYRSYQFNIGILSGEAFEAVIDNVHTNSTIDLNNSSRKLGLTNVGGLVGYGSVSINRSSNSGDIIGGVHDFLNDEMFTESYQTIGGLLGNSSNDGVSISNSINTGDIEGFSYLDSDTNLSARMPTLIGGVVGNIISLKFINVSNRGSIRASNSIGHNNIVYMGGVFGLCSGHQGGYELRHSLHNTGNLTLSGFHNSAKIAGIGLAKYKSSNSVDSIFLGLVNKGRVIEEDTNYPYDFAGVIFDLGSDLIIYGAINYADISLTLGNTRRINPLYYSENNQDNYNTMVINSSNYGNIDIVILSDLFGDVFINGITSSPYVSLKNCFNYGNINLNNINTSDNLDINIGGLIYMVNYSRQVLNSHNEGNIKVIATGNHIIKVGGIAVVNNITPNPEKDQWGLISNVTNNGLIEIKTSTQFQTLIGGIVSENRGLVEDAANLNDIAAFNDLNLELSTIQVVIGGIAGLNSDEKSQIIDTINYGNIYGKAYRFAFVGGILGNGQARLSQTKYALNYGNIYSFGIDGPNLPKGGLFSPSGKNTYDLNPEPYARSGGIVATGLSSFSNVINKGIVASNDVAGGLYGVVNAVNFSLTRGIEMTDSINYGKINTLYNLEMDYNQPNYADRYIPIIGPVVIDYIVKIEFNKIRDHITKNPYGGVVGYIWQQANDSAISNIKFRYLLNTDDKVNFIGRSSKYLTVHELNKDDYRDDTKGNADSSTIATTNKFDSTLAPFYNIRVYETNKNNTINVHQRALNRLGVNTINFHFSLINVDDEGSVIGQTSLLSPEYTKVNINVINSTITPYFKYRTYNFIHNSNEEVEFKYNFYDKQIIRITNSSLVDISSENYSIEDNTLIFHNSFVTSLPLGLNQFSVYLDNGQQLSIEINVLAANAFDNEYLNLKANNYTFNNVSEEYLNILVDFNYNVKATLTSVVSIYQGVETKISNENYQYLGIYSENFFMRKDSIFKLDAEGNRIYILHDYILYLEQDELPNNLYNDYQYGMYAISNSDGWTNGALFPVNIKLDDIDQTIDNSKDTQWRETMSSGRMETINEKFANMHQIGKSKQTTVFNLTLKDINNNNIILDHPFVDSELGQIIFYTNSDTPIGTIYQVDDYSIAYGSTIYAQYFEESDPLNIPIADASFFSSENDPLTYGYFDIVAEDTSIVKRWEIKVIMIGQLEFITPNVYVNNAQTTNFTYSDNFLNISSLETVHFKNGTLEINFNVRNLPNGYNVLKNITLYDQDIRGLLPSEFTGLIDKKLYTLSDGIVQADLFNRDTDDPYWYGQVTFKITLSQALHSGRFYIALSYYSKIYIIGFNKRISNENFIYNFSHETSDGLIEVVEPIGSANGYMTSSVDYGKLLDFQSGPIGLGEIPSYLTSVSVSYFARINNVELISYSTVEGYKTYVVHLQVVAESGAVRTWVHEIKEKSITSEVYRYFKDGILVRDGHFAREENYVNFEVFYYTNNIYDAYKYLECLEPTYPNYQDYLTISIDNSINLTFNEKTEPGEYRISFRYIREEYVMVGGSLQNISWYYIFDDVILVKNQNNNSYLLNITFFGSKEDTRSSEIKCIDPTHSHKDRDFRIIQNRITYGRDVLLEGDERCKEFNIIGYVSGIELSYYSPEFGLPVGSTIKRYVGQDEYGNDLWSDNLNADYTVYLFSKEFIRYRILSEDDLNESIYNIGVVDITYNVRFIYNILYNSDGSNTPEPFPIDLLNKYIYLSFTNFITNDDGSGLGSIIGVDNRMSLFYYISDDPAFSNRIFNFNKSGYYLIALDIPDNYTYQIEIDGVILDDFNYGYKGKTYYVEPDLNAKIYQVNIYIRPSETEKPWGINKIWYFWKNIFS